MEKLRTCFFTGHRRLPSGKIEKIKELLYEYIEKLIIEYDVKNFITGGALGFDTIAAEAVISMREKYPHIKLFLYLPCFGQSDRWEYNNKKKYADILSKADDILYVTEAEYSDGCMQLRNMRMVKDAYFCIAFCIMQRSGTGYTLRSARETGEKIYNIADEIYN